MNNSNVFMTANDYARLIENLNFLSDAVKEMSGVLMGYESSGFISPDSLQMAQDKASKAIELDKYWMRADAIRYMTFPKKKGEA
jgi:hypothetical protein